MTTLRFGPRRKVYAITLLQNARRRIESRRCGYICIALLDAAKEEEQFLSGSHKDVMWEVGHVLKNAIMKRLDGNSTLETWLKDRGYFADLHSDIVRETRLAWIDSLIAEVLT